MHLVTISSAITWCFFAPHRKWRSICWVTFIGTFSAEAFLLSTMTFPCGFLYKTHLEEDSQVVTLLAELHQRHRPSVRIDLRLIDTVWTVCKKKTQKNMLNIRRDQKRNEMQIKAKLIKMRAAWSVFVQRSVTQWIIISVLCSVF